MSTETMTPNRRRYLIRCLDGLHPDLDTLTDAKLGELADDVRAICGSLEPYPSYAGEELSATVNGVTYQIYRTN